MQRILLYRAGVLLSLLMVSLTCSSQKLTLEEQEELRSEIHSVSKSGFQDADWSFLDSQLKGKSMVLIGEFTHGAFEVFEMQNSLTKYLHENHGFDVVLFEAGVGELLELNSNKVDLTPQQLTSGFFGGWRNSSRRDLMAYIKENEIDFAGFDSQKFGSTFQPLLERVCTMAGLDQSKYEDVESRFDDLQSRFRNEDYFEIVEEVKVLQYDIQYLITELPKLSGSEEVVRTLQNRNGYLQYFIDWKKDNDWVARFNARDSLMASNIEWHWKNKFKGKKVIVISHNFHISKFNEKQESMGEILDRKFENESLVLGVFAKSGSYDDNRGQPRAIHPVEDSEPDIKDYMLSDDFCSALFVQDPLLSKDIRVNDTFIDLWNTKTLVPSKHFDVLLFLKEVTATSRK